MIIFPIYACKGCVSSWNCQWNDSSRAEKLGLAGFPTHNFFYEIFEFLLLLSDECPKIPSSKASHFESPTIKGHGRGKKSVFCKKGWSRHADHYISWLQEEKEVSDWIVQQGEKKAGRWWSYGTFECRKTSGVFPLFTAIILVKLILLIEAQYAMI